MKSKRMTTEEMVRKCFCNDCFPTTCTTKDKSKLAPAARSFVAMEQKQKWKVQRARIHKILAAQRRKNPQQDEVVLPKGFGTFKEGK